MISRVDGAHERSVALVELRYDKMLPAAAALGGRSHHTPQPHRNLVDGIITLKEHRRAGNISQALGGTGAS
jgi:hypothetical protein